jgi:hypothetical protein
MQSAHWADLMYSIPINTSALPKERPSHAPLTHFNLCYFLFIQSVSPLNCSAGLPYPSTLSFHLCSQSIQLVYHTQYSTRVEPSPENDHHYALEISLSQFIFSPIPAEAAEIKTDLFSNNFCYFSWLSVSLFFFFSLSQQKTF